MKRKRFLIKKILPYDFSFTSYFSSLCQYLIKTLHQNKVDN